MGGWTGAGGVGGGGAGAGLAGGVAPGTVGVAGPQADIGLKSRDIELPGVPKVGVAGALASPDVAVDGKVPAAGADGTVKVPGISGDAEVGVPAAAGAIQHSSLSSPPLPFHMVSLPAYQEIVSRLWSLVHLHEQLHS